MEITSVWHIAREYRGIAEAGGIKDVVRDLSESLAKTGIKVSVVIPFYGFMKPLEGSLLFRMTSFTVDFHRPDGGTDDERIDVYGCTLHGVNVFCLSSRHFADKSAVYTYTRGEMLLNPDLRQGRGHADAIPMSILFQLAAVRLMLSRESPPSVIHCHDSHTALVPAIIRERRECSEFFSTTNAVVTIHNAGPGYVQEIRDIGFLERATGIPYDRLERNSLHGALNPFLLASDYATLNTVSDNYARELLEYEEHGFSSGFGMAVRERGIRLRGITNGVNTEYLDPRNRTRSGLPASFDPSGEFLEGKLVCRRELQTRIATSRLPEGLTPYGSLDAEGEAPLYVLQSRLTHQKGISVLRETVRNLLEDRIQVKVLVLGQGDRELEEDLKILARSPVNGGRFCYIQGYEENTAKLLFAAADFFLIPSVYEPCGITDLFSLLCGTIPIVHRVGGLIKIEDGKTGYTYEPNTAEVLLSVILKTRSDYVNGVEKLAIMRKNGFNMVLTRYSWDTIVRDEYVPFYASCGVNPVFR